MRSPAAAPARTTIVCSGTVPKAVIETMSGPGLFTVSPPKKRTIDRPLHPRRALARIPRANALSQSLPAQGKPEKKPEAAPGALGGKIGEVHPQRLARDCARRIVRKEVHSPAIDIILSQRRDHGRAFGRESRRRRASQRPPAPRAARSSLRSIHLRKDATSICNFTRAARIPPHGTGAPGRPAPH